jgi:pyrroline-5-carboxylate reductase
MSTPLNRSDLPSVAVLGAGKMGEILAVGILRAALAPPLQVHLSDINRSRVADLVGKHGFSSETTNADAVDKADVILLSVKPQDIGAVLDEIAPRVRSEHVVISIAAGITTRSIEAKLPASTAVVRAMPNAAAAVGEGVTAICGGSSATEEHLALAERLLGGVGGVLRVAEGYIDAVTAISGSGPAYVALFAEAIIDAGVTVGLSRPIATELALRTVSGTAAMMSKGGMAPAAVREAVTSPGGTTAMALAELERAGVRAAVLNAVQAAAERARALSGEGRTER